MASNLTQAIKEAYAIASAKRVIVKTLSVSGLDSDNLNIVQGVKDFVATVDGVETVFSAVPFRFAPPGQSDEGAKDITVLVDILNDEVLEFFKRIVDTQAVIRLVYREWTCETGDWICGMPLDLYLSSLSFSETAVSIRAGFIDMINRAFPVDIYSPTVFFPLKH
jgi:hypothetical protein